MREEPSGRDPDEVVAAIKKVLHREVERVDDPVAGVPGGDLSDRDGLHGVPPGGLPDGPRLGLPLYDPEAWRWFDLVAVGYLDGQAFIKFAWTDPATPEARRYLHVAAAGYGNAEIDASLVRSTTPGTTTRWWRRSCGTVNDRSA